MASKNQLRHNRPENVFNKMPAKTPAKTKRGLKQAGLALDRAIKLSNLVPKGAVLPENLIDFDVDRRTEQGKGLSPTVEELEAAIASLSLDLADLAAHLVEWLHDEKWALEKSGTVQRVVARYNEIRSDREVLYRVIRLIEGKEIGYLRECPLCGQIFFAVRKNQTAWPEGCAKRQRDEKWRRSYEQEYGHAYRPKTREPRHVVKVRQALEGWKGGRFKPSLQNKKDLAAFAEVTLKQCETALDHIKDHNTKRAE